MSRTENWSLSGVDGAVNIFDDGGKVIAKSIDLLYVYRRATLETEVIEEHAWILDHRFWIKTVTNDVFTNQLPVDESCERVANYRASVGLGKPEEIKLTYDEVLSNISGKRSFELRRELGCRNASEGASISAKVIHQFIDFIEEQATINNTLADPAISILLASPAVPVSRANVPYRSYGPVRTSAEREIRRSLRRLSTPSALRDIDQHLTASSTLCDLDANDVDELSDASGRVDQVQQQQHYLQQQYYHQELAAARKLWMDAVSQNVKTKAELRDAFVKIEALQAEVDEFRSAETQVTVLRTQLAENNIALQKAIAALENASLLTQPPTVPSSCLTSPAVRSTVDSNCAKSGCNCVAPPTPNTPRTKDDMPDLADVLGVRFEPCDAFRSDCELLGTLLDCDDL